MGIFTWADGSTYESFWRAGRRHGLGVYRPPPPPENRRASAQPERHASPPPGSGARLQLPYGVHVIGLMPCSQVGVRALLATKSGCGLVLPSGSEQVTIGRRHSVTKVSCRAGSASDCYHFE